MNFQHGTGADVTEAQQFYDCHHLRRRLVRRGITTAADVTVSAFIVCCILHD